MLFIYNNYQFTFNIMKTETLYSIVNEIRVSRVKLNRFPTPLTTSLIWTS